VGFAVAGAAALGAVAVWLWPSSDPPPVSAVAAGDGAVVGWSGRF
jgi:hypothetical protein